MELRGALPVAGFAQLAKALGFSASEGGRFKGAAVEGHKAIETVLQALAKAEGGKLGQVTLEMGNTLPGLFQKAKTNWDLLLGSVSETQGFKNLVAVVGKFVALLDPAGPQGAAVIEFLSKAADGVADFLEPFTQPGAVQAGLDEIIGTVKVLWMLFDQMFVQPIAAAIRFFGWVVEINDKMRDFVTSIPAMVVKAVFSIGDAVKAAAGSVSGTALGLLGGAAKGVASALGVPMFAEGGYVDRPTLALVGEAGPEHIVPAGKMGGGGGITVHLQQSFSINADGSMTAGEIAKRIAEIGAGELVASLESMALGMGAT